MGMSWAVIQEGEKEVFSQATIPLHTFSWEVHQIPEEAQTSWAVQNLLLRVNPISSWVIHWRSYKIIPTNNQEANRIGLINGVTCSDGLWQDGGGEGEVAASYSWGDKLEIRVRMIGI